MKGQALEGLAIESTGERIKRCSQLAALRRVQWRMPGVWGQQKWILVMAISLSCWVTSGKLLHLSEPHL